MDIPPAPDPDPSGTPGERPPTGRRLERSPSARYGTRPGAAPEPAPRRPWRAIGVATGVALLGGLVTFVLGNLDLGAGLLAVTAGVGWITALALRAGGGPGGGLTDRRVRVGVAAGLAAAAVALALYGLGLHAQVEGGVLPPIDYLANRFGPLALLDILVAAVAAGVRAR